MNDVVAGGRFHFMPISADRSVVWGEHGGTMEAPTALLRALSAQSIAWDCVDNHAPRRLHIQHATNDDKEAYAVRLTASSGVDPAVIRFALTDAYGCGHDTGGNRNALLLAHAGTSYVTADDDTISVLRTGGNSNDDLA